MVLPDCSNLRVLPAASIPHWAPQGALHGAASPQAGSPPARQSQRWHHAECVPLCFENQRTRAARPARVRCAAAPSLPALCCWEIFLWFPKLGCEDPGTHWPPSVDNDIKLVGWAEWLSGGRVVRRESFHGNAWDIKGLGRAKKVLTVLALS